MASEPGKPVTNLAKIVRINANYGVRCSCGQPFTLVAITRDDRKLPYHCPSCDRKPQ